MTNIYERYGRLWEAHHALVELLHAVSQGEIAPEQVSVTGLNVHVLPLVEERQDKQERQYDAGAELVHELTEMHKHLDVAPV